MYRGFLKLLKGSEAAGLVGGRIYVGRRPQAASFPSIMISPDLTPEYSKDGSAVDVYSMTVDVFAETYRECKDIVNAVRNAVDFVGSYHSDGVAISNITLTSEIPSYDDTVDMNRIIQEYNIRVKR